MIKVVSWNIDKRQDPWTVLIDMADKGHVDLALLQEVGSPPGDLIRHLDYRDRIFWNRHLYDRWPLVVQLSDRVVVEPYQQVEPISNLGESDIGVSGIGTIDAAKVYPLGQEEDSFVAISMYARWLYPHPSTKTNWNTGYSDASAHRIISDLSAFIGHTDPSRHRILAAGDLNMFYGATGNSLSFPEREQSVWTRMQSLGMEFLGPQYPDGRQSSSVPIDVPEDTLNVPTHHDKRIGPAEASSQLDYVFASKGFHENVSVKALNEVKDWGPSDHCRIMIEVKV